MCSIYDSALGLCFTFLCTYMHFNINVGTIEIQLNYVSIKMNADPIYLSHYISLSRYREMFTLVYIFTITIFRL